MLNDLNRFPYRGDESFDPRFTYIINEWEEHETRPEDEEEEPLHFYTIYCHGFWDKKFVCSVPGVLTEKDLINNQTNAKREALLKAIHDNLVDSTYDLTLQNLGYEPYGPRSLRDN